MVIFGAGASYDSSPVFSAPPIGLIRTQDEPFRPPLTVNLFGPPRPDGAFDEALDAYPQLQTIGAFLRRVPTGTTLEQRLAQLQAEAKDIPGRHRELMAVRFYLQQILWATPERWYQRSHRASNYSTVIGRLRDWQTRTHEPVALVTFNYDLLLDHAYTAANDFDPASMNNIQLEGYLAISDFKLFKPHGSVNWARRIGGSLWQVPPDATGHPFIIQHAADVETTSSFEVVAAFNQVVSRFDQTVGLVSALAIPMDAKSIFEARAGTRRNSYRKFPQ